MVIPALAIAGARLDLRDEEASELLAGLEMARASARSR
jgi:hypothetical protein